MEYLVPCDCGRSVEVVAVQAGTTTTCYCGQTVEIPRLGELRKMAGTSIAEPDFSQNPEESVSIDNNNPFASPATMEAAQSEIVPGDIMLPPWFRFSGRASRAQYWAVSLGQFVGFWFCIVLASGSPYLALVALLGLFVLMWMGLATSVRRCHDRNKSGIFLFLYIVPCVGQWVIIELGFFPGTEGPNQYGADPASPMWHTG